MDCMICGTPALVTPSLIDREDRWDYPKCGTWGTVSRRDVSGPAAAGPCPSCGRMLFASAGPRCAIKPAHVET